MPTDGSESFSEVHDMQHKRVSREHGCAVWPGLLIAILTAGSGIAPAQMNDGERKRLNPGARYEYGYDPYNGTPEPLGYAAQGYSTDTYNWFVRPKPLPEQASISGDSIYGYVGSDDMDERVAPRARDNWEFGYYYNRRTGRLEYGWHYEAPPLERTVARPARREQWTPPPLGYVEPSDRQLAAPAPTAPEPQLRRFAGEVIDLATRTGRTDNRVYLIARIRQPDGTFQAVQTGPMGTASVRVGDWIEGFGDPEVIQGRPMILARRISIGGTWYTIPDTAAPEPRNYVGEVVGFEPVYLRNSRDLQIVADIRIGNSTRPVLLGPAVDLPPQEQLWESQVQFWAREGTLDGLPILVASQLDLPGRTLRLQHEEGRYAFESR